MNFINFLLFWQVLYLKLKEWRTVLWHVGEENKIKADLSIFFSCRAISSSEESSTVEYSECALMWNKSGNNVLFIFIYSQTPLIRPSLIRPNDSPPKNGLEQIFPY